MHKRTVVSLCLAALLAGGGIWCAGRAAARYVTDRRLERLYGKTVVADWNRKTPEGCIPFTLSFPGSEGKPVVRVDLNGKKRILLCDTGSALTFELCRGVCGCFEAEIASHVDGLDGFLGMDVLRTHANVVLDYRQKTLSFDQPPIDGEAVPLMDFQQNVVFAQYTVNGMTDWAMVDTGSETYLPRLNVLTEEFSLTEDDWAFFTDGDIRTVAIPAERAFLTVSFGPVVYTARQRFSTDSSVWMMDRARRVCTKVSQIGAPFFQNRRLQLDFEHMVLRMD